MPTNRLLSALPFWLSLGFIPLIAISAFWGSWTLILAPMYAFGLMTVLDKITGLNTDNPDIKTPESQLFWYRLITLIWPPIQLALIFGMIWWVTRTNHLQTYEILILFYAIGVATGGVGIVYAHELMHQKPVIERRLGDVLMASTLYSHFRSEHLRVHHLWVGTPRDSVTARYNEGFWRFFMRVLATCPGSAWKAERIMLARRGKTMWSAANPFWRYGALQLGFILLAWLIAGWVGVGLFVFQAFIAVLHLELTNYVEHYGLTREHFGDGRYEHVKPHHSWNASHTASNWLLINLQRHSDHHYKPDRRYPLLQTYDADAAPQLPLGYPTMVVAAAIPPLWRRIMNPRVRAWRRQFYPQITDWSAYKAGTTPMPRGTA